MDARTICAQGNRKEAGGHLTPPIVAAAAFEFDSQSAVDAFYRTGEGYVYSRYGNPTTRHAERFLARLEGAEDAALFGSGMAAIGTLCLLLAKSGDKVMAQEQLYGGTAQLFRNRLPELGIEVEFVDLDRIGRLRAGDLRDCRLLYLETPVNPVLRVVDLQRAAAVAHEAGAVVAVDGTFAPPVLQRALDHGVDFVIHSATKYLGGHNDLIGGAVVGSEGAIRDLALRRREWGGIMDPFTAFLLQRGMRTLAVRVEAQSRGARAVADALVRSEAVDVVHYPGLPDHPDEEIVRRQMTSGGAMVAFTVRGGAEAAVRVHDRLQLFAHAGSLGGTESLVSIPARMSHRHLSAEELARAGVSPGLLRLSVGLEAPADLIADLEQALG
jgi:cystathionine beta-lyase/cystathionine gamma-synthase